MLVKVLGDPCGTRGEGPVWPKLTPQTHTSPKHTPLKTQSYQHWAICMCFRGVVGTVLTSYDLPVFQIALECICFPGCSRNAFGHRSVPPVSGGAAPSAGRPTAKRGTEPREKRPMDRAEATPPGALSHPFFGWEGSPTKIDYRKSWYPYCKLSTGGPSHGCHPFRITWCFINHCL